MASSSDHRRPVRGKQPEFTEEWHDKRKEIQESVDYYKDLLQHKKKRDRKLRKNKIKKRGDSGPPLHLDIVDLMEKEGRCVHTAEQVGSLEGIKVGDDYFNSRGELFVAGLHRSMRNGIHYSRFLDGETAATSIVDSDRYQRPHSSGGGIYYRGEGSRDHQIVKGNKALMNNLRKKQPVRYIKKVKVGRGVYKFKYEGLYRIKKYDEVWEKTTRCSVYIFELEKVKDKDQYKPEWLTSNTS